MVFSVPPIHDACKVGTTNSYWRKFEYYKVLRALGTPQSTQVLQADFISILALIKLIYLFDSIIFSFITLPQLLSISNLLPISYSNCPCMVALTFDRVVAISLPFKHRTIFTKWVCIGICVAVWLPQVLFYCWFIGTMFTNEETVSVSTYELSCFTISDWVASCQECLENIFPGYLNQWIGYNIILVAYRK